MTEAHLDRRLEGTSPGVSVTYPSVGSSTLWTLPYAVAIDGSQGELVVVRQDTGETLQTTRPTADTVRAVGDFSATPVWIGVIYEFLYRPTRIFLRDQQGQPELYGRLQLRYLDLLIPDTSGLDVTVIRAGRPNQTQRVSGPRARVPILAQNEQVTLEFSDRSPGAVRLVGLDWEGFTTQRARRWG
jgi:hypothetical protein